jgi:hypothetical protein
MARTRYHDLPNPIPPKPGVRCTCGVMNVYIPPGEHIHVQCPAHGDIIIRGSGCVS